MPTLPAKFLNGWVEIKRIFTRRVVIREVQWAVRWVWSMRIKEALRNNNFSCIINLLWKYEILI